MFVKFITSKLLRVIVCAAAGLYGLYNAISCFVTLYKAGHLPAFGGAGMALPQRNEKTAGKDRSPVNLRFFCNVFPLCALLG